jgi:HD-GYP domain-containing protein (c-di-GMP phosphodiesterase class II)
MSVAHAVFPSNRKLLTETLFLGMTVPWSLYDADLNLLLLRGVLINNPRMLELLMQKAVYRDLSAVEEEETIERIEASRPSKKTIIQAKHELEESLEPLLRALVEGGAGHVVDAIPELANTLQELCEYDADAILAAMHLAPLPAYATLHPIHSAILCELLAKQLEMEAGRRASLLAAALTMNAGMLDLQNQLFEQTEPLTSAQKAAILQHPEVSVKALLAAGVKDRVWLMTVHQHHERIDGSGYPKHFKGEQICVEAKILALADMYAALVTPRKHRKPVLAKDALRTIFLNRGKEVDEELATQFIRVTGIFPPGVFVRLGNGEVAVVARRPIVSTSRDTTAPIAYALISPFGKLYDAPKHRDCANERYHIEEMCLPDIDRAAVLHGIWGF